MRPSTVAELLGFGCLSAAAFLWAGPHQLIPGFLVAGVCLLLIGYGTEDPQASLAISRMLAPFSRRLMVVRVKHQNRVARRRNRRRERARDRRSLLHRPPAEVMLRVKAD